MEKSEGGLSVNYIKKKNVVIALTFSLGFTQVAMDNMVFHVNSCFILKFNSHQLDLKWKKESN